MQRLKLNKKEMQPKKYEETESLLQGQIYQLIRKNWKFTLEGQHFDERAGYCAIGEEKDYTFSDCNIGIQELVNHMIATSKSKSLNILEIGAALGNTLVSLKEKHGKNINVWGITATDFRANNGLEPKDFLIVGDAHKLLTFSELKNVQFDLIYSRMTFLHLADPMQVLIDACKKLNDKGIFIIDEVCLLGIEKNAVLDQWIQSLAQQGYEVAIEYACKTVKLHSTLQETRIPMTLFIRKSGATQDLSLPIVPSHIARDSDFADKLRLYYKMKEEKEVKNSASKLIAEDNLQLARDIQEIEIHLQSLKKLFTDPTQSKVSINQILEVVRKISEDQLTLIENVFLAQLSRGETEKYLKNLQYIFSTNDAQKKIIGVFSAVFANKKNLNFDHWLYYLIRIAKLELVKRQESKNFVTAITKMEIPIPEQKVLSDIVTFDHPPLNLSLASFSEALGYIINEKSNEEEEKKTIVPKSDDEKEVNRMPIWDTVSEVKEETKGSDIKKSSGVLSWQKNYEKMFAKALIQEQEMQLTSGPLPLEPATEELQVLIKNLLDSKIEVVFFHTDDDHLWATFEDKMIDITKCFQDGANLNHIILSDKELAVAADYLNSLEPSDSKFSEKYFEEKEALEGMTKNTKFNISRKDSYL